VFSACVAVCSFFQKGIGEGFRFRAVPIRKGKKNARILFSGKPKPMKSAPKMGVSEFFRALYKTVYALRCF
jgi:hypothetical protein